MVHMKYIVYGHRSVTPLLVVLLRLVWRMVGRLLSPDSRWPAIRRHWRRILVWTAVVASLVVQAVMLWILGELVDLCIALMEVWTELAYKHLELVES